MAGARREEEVRRAAEKAADDARIEDLVNERVTATQVRMEQLMEQKLAEQMAAMEVRQRAEQQSTEDLRSGTEDTTPAASWEPIAQPLHRSGQRDRECHCRPPPDLIRRHRYSTPLWDPPHD
ncbi:unnamed protein product [Ectocarpus sp. CCAP 1310/34]|nr:unnamed protein product [Ectocarpus sp. CCAP 1310/34]